MLKQPVLLSERLTLRPIQKAKADWYSFGGTPGWGYRAIAKHFKIPIA